MAKRVVLIGHPVSQSLSVVLQQAAFEASGIDATYEPLDRPLIELAETIAELRGDEYLGANITVPFKDRVLPMLDRLTDEAHATGAVDTITREGTRLVGHNTDVLGFRPTLDALVGRCHGCAQLVLAHDPHEWANRASRELCWPHEHGAALYCGTCSNEHERASRLQSDG